MREATGVQAPFELIDCGVTTLAVARRGSGVPVLCLHATGHGGRDFEDFADRVAPKGFEVVTVDFPGHGNSPDQPTGMTASAAAYAPLIEALIPKLWPGGESPIILGNSIGGATAISLAAKRPELSRALVLCNPGGLAPINFIAKLYIGWMVRFFEEGAAGKANFPAKFAKYYRKILQEAPADQQRIRIVAAGREMAPLLAQAWDSFRKPEADIRAYIPTLKCPILYAWAKEDRIVSWRFSKKAALTASDHRVALLPGGHSAFLEAPEAFDAVFLDFANALKGSAND